ncbi:ORF6N domain-containing protein [Alistipes sp.]|uniref:ORF6N domain-containing protein n=1 Tax=Alistipes sp. TaxID=1872444 RepID=UPI003AEF6110
MEELSTIQSKIYEIRGQRVMLDFDLAALYQVETRTLKQAVRRNIERFPDDFMLRLTSKEAMYLINIGVSRNVIPPEYNIGSTDMFAFTEEGVAMLSGVLRNKVAVELNITIMRAFVSMRNFLNNQQIITAELSEIRSKLALLERVGQDNAAAVSELSEDMGKELDTIYEAIAALSVKLPQARKQPRPIGFRKEKQ